MTTKPRSTPLRVVPRPATALPRPPSQPPDLSHEETIEDLLTQSARGMVPIRKAFVQQPIGSPTRPGPLSAFVKAHDERGLDLYVFVHALASSPPFSCTYPSETWARVLDLSSSCEDASAKAAVSKVLKRLEDRQLVLREARRQRKTVVRILREDGSGQEYTRPVTAADGAWLNLPYAYWRREHHRALNLPGKAMLLVALSLPEEFVLPQERMPAWYGWSADTAGTGLAELRDLGVLTSRRDFVKDHRSHTGWREEQHHQLTGPYSVAARKAAAAVRRTPRKTAKTGDEAAAC